MKEYIRKNIGTHIKIAALIICGIIAFFGLIAAAALISIFLDIERELFWLISGIITGLLSFFIAYLIFIFIYGFGCVVDDMYVMRKYLCGYYE